MVASMIISIDKAGSSEYHFSGRYHTPYFAPYPSLCNPCHLIFLSLRLHTHTETWLLVPPNENLAGIPKKNARTIRVNYDSIWTRDYGPVGGIVDASPNSSRAIVNAVYGNAGSRPFDDEVPCHMANSFRNKMPCRSTSIIMDGGNLMFDGRGGLFTTTITYDWNDHWTPQQVDQELKAAFGVKYIYSIDYAKIPGTREPADGTGHLDMFVKILAPCVVIVAEAPQGDTEYYSVLNKAARYFSNLQCQTDEDGSSASSTTGVYQVHRVPAWDEQGTWYTFTNSLIVNDRVIVPSYSSSSSTKKNNQALSVYNTAAPHLTVDFVDSDGIIQLGGAIHCITREIPRLPRRAAL
jgi:agmatine/peptidylarginine deiminase